MINKITLCTFSILCCAFSPLIAQDDSYAPPAFDYPLKVVKSTNSSNSIESPVWLTISNKRSLIFYQGWDNAKQETILYSAVLNSKGKLSKPTRFFSYGPDSPWEDMRAVWFEGKNGKPGRGLLFTFYIPDLQNSQYREIELAAMPFDEKGKHLSGDHVLFNKKADAGETIARPGIAVVQTGDQAAVLLSVMFFKNTSAYSGFTSTDMYFFITDSSGKPKVVTAEAAKFGPEKINADNEVQTVYLYDAAWNGKRWLAVGELSHLKIVDRPGKASITEQIRTDLMAYIAVPKKSGGMKYLTRRLLTLKTKHETSFDSVQFLPLFDAAGGLSPSGVGENLRLFYRIRDFLGFGPNSIYPEKLDYALMTLNGRGKKVGKPIKLRIPEWTIGVKYSSNLKMARFGQHVGNILPLANGRYAIGLNRHLIVWHYGSSPPATPVYGGERQLNLFWFNPVTGYAALLARDAKKMPANDPPFWEMPLLNLFGKNICVVNQLKPFFVKQWRGTVYFSRFSDLP